MSDPAVVVARMNVVAYLRVSSRDQDFATQPSAIERAAKARGDEITEWRSEKRSGKPLHRSRIK